MTLQTCWEPQKEGKTMPNGNEWLDYIRWRIAALIMPRWMLRMIREAVDEMSRNIERRF